MADYITAVAYCNRCSERDNFEYSLIGSRQPKDKPVGECPNVAHHLKHDMRIAK